MEGLKIQERQTETTFIFLIQRELHKAQIQKAHK